jgi:hypothetical protein
MVIGAIPPVPTDPNWIDRPDRIDAFDTRNLEQTPREIDRQSLTRPRHQAGVIVRTTAIRPRPTPLGQSAAVRRT